MLIDITRPLFPGMPVYPGDPPVVLEWLSRLQDGVDYSLSALSLCLHSGTHMDAPSHVLEGGASIDSLELSQLVLIAHVVDTLPAMTITPEHLPDNVRKGEALLFRNLGIAGESAYAAPRVDIAKETALKLVKSGVALVGTECMDVEREDADGLPVHNILASAGVLIVENLDLSQIKPGTYKLWCLPLRIVGAEASPCRALLETLK